MARKSVSKLASHELDFIAAALKYDKNYNLGALIAHCLSNNHEKGSICGCLIASRLLAFHGLLHHELDLAFNKGKLDLDSMMHHRFVSFGANGHDLPYEIYFWMKNWRQTRINRIIQLPAQPLFSLCRRDSWSIEEHE